MKFGTIFVAPFGGRIPRCSYLCLAESGGWNQRCHRRQHPLIWSIISSSTTIITTPTTAITATFSNLGRAIASCYYHPLHVFKFPFRIQLGTNKTLSYVGNVHSFGSPSPQHQRRQSPVTSVATDSCCYHRLYRRY